MTRIATAVLAAITLIGAGPALAAGKPAKSSALPSSYAPRPHSDNHVYGSPIETYKPAPAQPGHRQHAPTKPGATPTARHAQHHRANARRTAPGPQPSPT